MLRFLIFILCLFCLSAKAQTDRPKVGLVLSGGSAHGLAHIGVLKYLEEQGIQIDYITGTSMGAIIGGLYALGNSADDIYQIAEELDWDLVMSNHSPLNEVSPAEKAYHEKIPLSLLWNNSTFNFPQGLIRGQKLDLLVSNTFSSAYFVTDFDKLPIPYRCVAVDLEEGNIRVFDSGYLGEAVRASMAIPSVFPPKEIDDRLYVDGGLIRNFPVEENIQMGSDILIGVYVGSKKEKRDKLNSMFAILRQSASMAALLDSEHQSNMLDVLIEPAVKDLGSFDFNNYDAFIQLGYEAAESQSEKLAALADSLHQFGPKAKVQKLDRPDSILINQIHTSESDPVFRKMILNKLKFAEKQKTTLSEIEESISLVYGTKNFSKASYSFYQASDGYGLYIDTKEVNAYSIGMSVNRFKHYNTSFIFNGEARNIFGKPSRVRLDARLSENPGFQIDYILRIPRAPSYFFKVDISADRHELPFYNKSTVDRLYQITEWSSRISINKEWKNAYLFSLGYQYNFDVFTPKVYNANDIKKYRTIQDQVYLAMEYNNLDRTVFPEHGLLARLNVSGIFNNRLKRSNQTQDTDFFTFEEDKKFFLADFQFDAYLHSHDKLCHEFNLNARYATGESFTRSYKVGGPIQENSQVFGFLGVDDSELIIGNHISMKYGLRLNLSSSVYFTPAVQYLYGHNYLSYAFDTDKDLSILSYGIIMGLVSPLGPLALDLGLSNKTDRLVLNFGIGFRHIL